MTCQHFACLLLAVLVGLVGCEVREPGPQTIDGQLADAPTSTQPEVAPAASTLESSEREGDSAAEHAATENTAAEDAAAEDSATDEPDATATQSHSPDAPAEDDPPRQPPLPDPPPVDLSELAEVERELDRLIEENRRRERQQAAAEQQQRAADAAAALTAHTPARETWRSVMAQMAAAAGSVETVSVHSIDSQYYEDLADWRSSLSESALQQLSADEPPEPPSASGPGWRLEVKLVTASGSDKEGVTPPAVQQVLEALSQADGPLSHATVTDINRGGDQTVVTIQCIFKQLP